MSKVIKTKIVERSKIKNKLVYAELGERIIFVNGRHQPIDVTDNFLFCVIQKFTGLEAGKFETIITGPSEDVRIVAEIIPKGINPATSNPVDDQKPEILTTKEK